MDKIEKIRQEIERMKRNAESAKKEWNDGNYNQNAFAEDCRISSFDHLLAFLHTLESEKPMNQDGLEEEILNQWEDYPHDKWPKCPYRDFTNIARHFAEWQEEQMMKDAVEGRIGTAGFHNSIFIKEPEWAESLDRLNKGDKVRIVILKAEE